MSTESHPLLKIEAPKPLNWVQFALILLILLSMPWIVDLLPQSNYLMDVIVTITIYVSLALGLNVVVGLSGQLVLGYIAFYAVGAYTTGILTTTLQWGFWSTLPMGMLTAALAGLLVGLPTLRVRGDYLAIVTLGFGEITRIILNNWDDLTNGPKGIVGVGKPMWGEEALRQPHELYYVVLGIAFVTWLVVRNLDLSAVGRAWVALREDELAAGAMGVNTSKVKLLAFSISAAFAGLVGSFFASKMGFISPESFTFLESIIVLAMVVLGGLGSIPGVILGATLLIALPEVLRALPELTQSFSFLANFDFNQYRMLLFGLAMILIMLLRPQGLIGDPRHKRELAYKTADGDDEE